MLGISHAGQRARVTLDIPSMDCALCPITISKALKRVPGVLEVRAELKTRTATVDYDPAATAPAQIEQAVTKAGYPAKVRTP